LPNEWLPFFLSDRAERVMSTRAVKRPIFIEHHLLNQMFAAAKKHVAHASLVLNHAPQLSLCPIAPVLEHLLKFIHHENDVRPAFRTNSSRRFQNFFHYGINPRVFHHPSPNGENGYSIEVFNALGDTVAVTAVPESALESLRRDEVLSVRPLTRETIQT
jgi:hypothetical protein